MVVEVMEAEVMEVEVMEVMEVEVMEVEVMEVMEVELMTPGNHNYLLKKLQNGCACPPNRPIRRLTTIIVQIPQNGRKWSSMSPIVCLFHPEAPFRAAKQR